MLLAVVRSGWLHLRDSPQMIKLTLSRALLRNDSISPSTRPRAGILVGAAMVQGKVSGMVFGIGGWWPAAGKIADQNG